MEKQNVFVGRSLTVIEDLSKEERMYLFEQVRTLKRAMETQDTQTLERFRINDKDFGIYEVFLEDSTRTKESFRNAANFHHVKVSELNSDSSSFNKGESYADTFYTLSGYANTIFIIRSKLEGVCRWLEETCTSYAERNHLYRKPVFINAGDGKHEHPTQELLDEFTFLEDNDWSSESLHVALVGDLFHGRTVHSKADGLKIFNRVKVDLIAPPELAMPETYVQRMLENGYELRFFDSIDDYLAQPDRAAKWYFTRPQLERMGDRILQRQAELRRSITFRREFMDKLAPNTKFYHPLPRHKVNPTIPTFLDETELNGWERQSINGMYVRIVLLSLIAGRIGNDFLPPARPEEKEEEDYIQEVDLSSLPVREKVVSEGVQPIHDGLVIDHILKGDAPGEIRNHMRLISSVLGLDEQKGGEWVSTGHKDAGTFKGIIFRPGSYELHRKHLKRLSAVAPGCTLNLIKDGKVAKKYRLYLPPRIYNFDDLACTNEACISHPEQHEGVPALFYRTKDNHFACAYCGKNHSFKEIWKSKNK
ncbi:MAG: bifunctional aspartate carbamoyltransferase catalytic subunit/aspartate carbamoyltransferase regulatory subunit [Sphaerochaeta sp.]|jgi:aspartate carbamoyltransferase|uniref:bifunctional aspartate carbamoyltransferase catalytic subunit/aspartate carbamoyltransferase regulatory subunit n=1 Tax=Sphaerochaeta sp. TaxID=1972642 RepID=UPI002FC9FBDA